MALAAVVVSASEDFSLQGAGRVLKLSFCPTRGQRYSSAEVWFMVGAPDEVAWWAQSFELRLVLLIIHDTANANERTLNQIQTRTEAEGGGGP